VRVVFDLYFAEPRSPEDDAADAIKQAGNVVLAEQLKAREISSTAGRDRAAGHRLVETVTIESLSNAAFATAPFVCRACQCG
jgi:hypothetical protein